MREQAERIAARIPNINLRANKIAESIWTGLHSRKKVGPGESFWQFRKYEHGDPAQLIDWRRTAKTNEIFIQERELETVQNIVLWRDTSDSMNFTSDKNIDKKIERANLIIITLSIILAKSGENISLNGHKQKPLRGKSATDFISEEILKNVKNSYKEIPDISEIKNNSHVVFIGDFLLPISKLEESFKMLSNKNIHANFVHILDPSEHTLPYKGRVNFNSLEDDTSILIGNVESVKKDFISNIESHYKNLKDLILSYSWQYLSHTTSNLPEEAIRSIYFSLSSYRKQSI